MSQITCDNLQEYVRNFSLVNACDFVKSGALRIATPFTYPNGSHIDLFLAPKERLFTSFILSDYGQTYEYLLNMGFDIWGTKRRRQIITDDICRGLGVRYSQNMFEVEILPDELNSLSSFMVRLAQACIRVADLSFTQRLQTYATFETEVEEFIAINDFSYDVEPPDLIGIFNKPVKVDFRVQGKRISSLVQALSSRNPTSAHTSANELFVRWNDLQNYRNTYQFITVYDDASTSMRDDDIARLNQWSTVFGFPHQREQFRETLAA
jgi:hypothetical protein